MTKIEPDEGMRTVTLPSGALFQVHERESTYFQERARRYMGDNDFSNISDLQDVDRLLMIELLCHRWATYISQERDYWGEPVDEPQLQRALKDGSTEIRQIKKSLGLDRETREKTRGEDSPENYLMLLRQRAKHFGYMRNQQASKAIELFMELKGLITLHLNCDHQEQVEQKCQVEDVIKFLVDVAIPEFDLVDADFRETEQKYWIRKI